jgi:inner membrane protein involved in colicin E2 resistance
MRAQLHALQGSVTGKVLFIGLLTLLLLIPLGMIQGLIGERAALYETARADIASSSCRFNTRATRTRSP